MFVRIQAGDRLDDPLDVQMYSFQYILKRLDTAGLFSDYINWSCVDYKGWWWYRCNEQEVGCSEQHCFRWYLARHGVCVPDLLGLCNGVYWHNDMRAYTKNKGESKTKFDSQWQQFLHQVMSREEKVDKEMMRLKEYMNSPCTGNKDSQTSGGSKLDKRKIDGMIHNYCCFFFVLIANDRVYLHFKSSANIC